MTETSSDQHFDQKTPDHSITETQQDDPVSDSIARDPPYAAPTKRCMHCESEISTKASTCPVCQKLQSRWKQSMAYWAGTIGLFTGLLALSLVVYSFFGNLVKRVTIGDKISIISLRTQGEAIVANQGYRDIALLRVEMDIPDLGCSGIFPIRKIISKDELVTVPVGDILIENYGISNGDTAEWDALMKGDDGFFCGAIIEEDAEFIHVKEHLGENLHTYECNLNLAFRPAGAAEDIETVLHCVGLILYDRSILSQSAYQDWRSKITPAQ